MHSKHPSLSSLVQPWLILFFLRISICLPNLFDFVNRVTVAFVEQNTDPKNLGDSHGTLANECCVRFPISELGFGGLRPTLTAGFSRPWGGHEGYPGGRDAAASPDTSQNNGCPTFAFMTYPA